MLILSLLKIIFLIGLSGCKQKEIINVQTLNIRDNLVNHRELTFDNKNKTMSSKFLFTEPIGNNQQGLICITPADFNNGYVRWQSSKCD